MTDADPPPRMPPIRQEELNNEMTAFCKNGLVAFSHRLAATRRIDLRSPPDTGGGVLSVQHPSTHHQYSADPLATDRHNAHRMDLQGPLHVVEPPQHKHPVCLPPSIFRPIQVGADDPYFTQFERVVIRATEDLIRDKKISDANWQELMQEWSNQQMLDFLFTVGAYVTVAGVMRSTGVQRNPDLLALAAEYGAPS